MFLNIFLPYPGFDPNKSFYTKASWQHFVLQQPDWLPYSSQEPITARTVHYTFPQLHVTGIRFDCMIIEEGTDCSETSVTN